MKHVTYEEYNKTIDCGDLKEESVYRNLNNLSEFIKTNEPVTAIDILDADESVISNDDKIWILTNNIFFEDKEIHKFAYNCAHRLYELNSNLNTNNTQDKYENEIFKLALYTKNKYIHNDITDSFLKDISDMIYNKAYKRTTHIMINLLKENAHKAAYYTAINEISLTQNIYKNRNNNDTYYNMKNIEHDIMNQQIEDLYALVKEYD